MIALNKKTWIINHLGSPFPVNVIEVQRMIAIGNGLGSVPVNIPTSFAVLTHKEDVGKMKCIIKGGL